MSLIRRKWTPAQADEWTKEDWYAIILSVLAFVFLTLGAALSLLLFVWGYVILFFGIVTTALMFYIIDPKLSVLSADYDKKQREYLEELEKIERWEEES
ncbi:MAG: hypothetical protein GXO76_11625 [Calditrichaeota bacterium]|nr:hypothetical protein [Calditrichota bacterium]